LQTFGGGAQEKKKNIPQKILFQKAITEIPRASG
jgi:hypothetical protein